jgi:hypothetical protein
VAAAARQVPSLDHSGGEQFVACVLTGSNARQQAEEQKRATAAAAAAAAATRHQQQAGRQARPSARAAGAPYQSYAAARRLAAAAPQLLSQRAAAKRRKRSWTLSGSGCTRMENWQALFPPEGIPCWTWEEVSFGMVGRGRD